MASHPGSRNRDDSAPDHLGWLAPFAGMDLPASSAWTREQLGREPKGPGIIQDLRNMDYGAGKA